MPERPATWEDVISAVATSMKVPPTLALAVARAETGTFDPAAVSKKGAIGIMQLMPETARTLGVDPYDPVQNIKGGVQYLRDMLDQHGGNVTPAIWAYNAGPGAVAGAGGKAPFPETEAYGKRVLQYLSERRQAAAAPPPLPPEALGVAPPTLPSLPTLPEWAAQKAYPRPEAGLGRAEAITGPPSFGERVGHAAFRAGEMAQPLVEAFDPRWKEGRRNIAGAAGATLATLGTGGLGAGGLTALGLRAAIPPILGAAAGGAAEETGEQLLAPGPPTPLWEKGTEIAKAAGQQGAYEIGGQLFSWPLKALGRRAVAFPVGKHAKVAVQQALTTSRDVLALARTQGTEAVRGAIEKRAGSVQAAQIAGRELVRGTKAEAAGATAAIGQRLEAIPRGVSPTRAGQLVGETLEGPIKNVKRQLGEAVERTAETGPDVDITALKAQAQGMVEHQLKPPAEAFPRARPEKPPGTVTAEMALGGFAPTDPHAIELAAALKAAQMEERDVLIKHPAMGVISRILDAEDVVPFKAAHQFKRDLMEAVNWEHPAQKKIGQMTKGLSLGLREALRGHEPYNVATKAYERFMPLLEEGIPPPLMRTIASYPEQIVPLVRPGKATELEWLRHLLVDRAAEGGNAQLGQAAFDSVRAAWTHNEIIQGTGGVAKLWDRITTLETKYPEFVRTMYGDQSGGTVLNNLKDIAAAYKQTAEIGAKDVADAVAQGQAMVSGARFAGAADVRAARYTAGAQTGAALEQVKRAKQVATELLSATPGLSLEQLVADVLRAVLLGPKQIWGGLSWARLLLQGPKGKDLVRWAAFSSARTQLLVRACVGPEPGMAFADLARVLLNRPEKEQQESTPPPVLPTAAQGPPPTPPF